MTNFRNGVAIFASALLTFCLSNNVSAFTVWAVDGGADASTNTVGNLLTVSPGTNAIDLYFDTEGEVSWGWDISLGVTGSALIYNVTGGDINGNLGAPLVNGYQQLGGNAAVDLNGGPILLFSFTYDSNEGDLLSLLDGSNYTNGSTIYDSVALSPVNLVATSSVPLPASGWLLLSGLGALRLIRKNQ